MRRMKKASAGRKTSQRPSKSKRAASKSTVAVDRVPFVKEGRIEWAVLAESAAADLEAFAADFFEIEPDFDAHRSWGVVDGKKTHSALIETAPGSAAGERDIAKALAKKLGTTVYALAFSGYDDPDHGPPYIDRYARGAHGTIWMAPCYDDDGGRLEIRRPVKGPPGIPSDDPFDFAAALGCDLRRYFER
jgi:hypothetical protein